MGISLTLSNLSIGQRKIGRDGLGWRAWGFLGALVAIGIAAAVGEYFVATPASEASEASTAAVAPAVFSGEFIDGVPVYRLPPISVVARRVADGSR